MNSIIQVPFWGRATIIFTCFLVISVTCKKSFVNNSEESSSQGLRGPRDMEYIETELEHRQRVFFLAGPHKTSSSSIQLNLYEWIRLGQSNQLSELFSWPAPSDNFLDAGCDEDEHLETKMFYPWIEAIKGQKGQTRGCFRNKYHSPEEARKVYSDKFYSSWVTDKKSLVIATEAMDFISSERRPHSEKILDGMIDDMPWNRNRNRNLHESEEEGFSESDITAVITFRTPRSSHLVSLWHQCCMDDMSFYEYLTIHLNVVADPIRSIDSLKLTQIFSKRGLKVDLIDLSGVSAEGYDVSNVVACDVLGAECTSVQVLADIVVEDEPAVANVKPHKAENFNVTDWQIDRIDEAIRTYDCNFLPLLEDENIRILYGHDLNIIFSECEQRHERLRSRDELVDRIIEIALDSSSEVDVDDDLNDVQLSL
mmetsp:Transcript_14075/g.20482  ORF Transcript_14075/g.20482 Transcript_14075/m.20482 type:complete len:425 (+) Transcript_14075:213-1487(+)